MVALLSVIALLFWTTESRANDSLFQGPYSSVGRIQSSYQNTDLLRASESYFISTASHLFLLEAFDYNYFVSEHAFDWSRFQLFAGGPLAIGDAPQLFGWVARFDDATVRTTGQSGGSQEENLAAVRLGGQVSAQQIAPFKDWFRRNQAELFVQIFPLGTNHDFGDVDTFTRFSKRFSPHFVARGVVRTYHFAGLVVATFENDFIYELNKRHDIFFRIDKASRDYLGLAYRQFLFGVGTRLNF